MNKYVILAEYYHLIEEEINKIIDLKTETIIFDAETSQFQDVIIEIGSQSLFSTKRTIVYRNFHLSKEQEKFEKFIIDYNENLNPDITLILTTNKKLDSRKKIIKLFRDSYKIIDLLNEKDYFYIDRLSELIKEKGYSINNNDLRLIWERAIKNYDIAINELNKLFIVSIETKKIIESDIFTHVPKYIVNEIFEIKEAIIKGRASDYISLLDDYKDSKKSMIPLMTLLANEYRLIYLVKNTEYSDQAIANSLGMRSDYPVKLARGNVHLYTNDDLLDNLLELADLDIKIKSGIIEEYLGFDLFLLEIKGDLK